MRKRCLVLAFLLALTAVFSVHALAAATVMRSEITLVEVTVPSEGRIALNPYGLPVKVDNETTTEQVASDTMPITNNGDAPVVVSARTSGRVSEHSAMTFVSAPPSENSAEKEVFVYTEFQSKDGDWSGQYSGEDNQLLVSEGTSEAKEVLTLDANGEGKFRLFGAMSPSPAEPWGNDDEIKVTVVFTFTPVNAPEDAAPDEDTEPTEDTEPPAEDKKPTEDKEPPAEEPPVEEPPAEEPPAEEPPAEEPPAEEPPAEEPPAEEPPAEEPPVEEPPVEEPPTEEEPPADSETEDTPTEAPPVTPEEPGPAPDSELPEEPEN